MRKRSAIQQDFGEQLTTLGKGWEIGVEGEFAVELGERLVFHIIISIFRSRKLPPETPTSGGRLNRFGVPTHTGKSALQKKPRFSPPYLKIRIIPQLKKE